jgi:hypothetical protein
MMSLHQTAEGGVAMNPSLTSALSEFSKKSEFSKSGLAAELSDEPPLHPSELNLIKRVRLWLGKLFAFARFLMIFFIGVVATLTWQSYGGAARERMASWSPRLGWLAPPAVPAGASSDRLVAISRDLAMVRQNVDKLAADVTKLATQPGVPPAPAVVPVRKPVLQPSRMLGRPEPVR